MTAYERQVRQTEAFYDEQIAAIEGEGGEILSSVVAGSRLHEILANPYEEGIAEG
jgi:hypothetical protein